MSIVNNNGFYPIQRDDPFSTNTIPRPDSLNIHNLVSSASQLVFNDQNNENADDVQKGGFGNAAFRLKEQLHRRLSRTPSIGPESPTKPNFVHHVVKKPTIFVIEPVHMPTIRSIDEIMNDEKVISSPSTESLNYKSTESLDDKSKND